MDYDIGGFGRVWVDAHYASIHIYIYIYIYTDWSRYLDIHTNMPIYAHALAVSQQAPREDWKSCVAKTNFENMNGSHTSKCSNIKIGKTTKQIKRGP